MAVNAAIRVENLSKIFGNDKAVDDISFDIPQGSIVGLLGGNGAGKTTTLSMLLGVVLPSSGSITIRDINMLKHRHRVLSYMNFSSPYVDLPQKLTVQENLTVFSHFYNIKNFQQRIQILAQELDLIQLLDKAYGNLSAGQKTRVLLAKSLINSPEILLLDEPTASLDPDTADWIRTYLMKWQKNTGATILLASHNMDEVTRMCDYIMILKAGKIAAHGTADELIDKYNSDDLENVFLHIARRKEN